MVKKRILALVLGVSFTLAPVGTTAANASPMVSHSPAIAAAYEWNTAVAGSVPDGLPCVSMTGATACFEHDGDKWWVKDTKADGHSATASWENYLSDGTFYRFGSCVNKLGNGKWGVCNKNYYETSYIYWEACVYDSADGTWHGCSGSLRSRIE